MFWRARLLLLATVSAVHLWVVFGILSTQRTAPLSDEIHHTTLFHATLSSSFGDSQQSDPLPIASFRVPKSFKIKPASPPIVTPLPEPTSSAHIRNLISNPTPHFNSEEFLEASSLDETATPMEGFGEALSLLFPPTFQSLVIEFWIDSGGNIADARCMEGNCVDLSPESLNRLLELHFYPAIKDGLSVPSRKLIQIDSSSAFGG
jgi:hypothetical protein